MEFIQASGIICSVSTGWGKRFSLKGIDGYPSSDCWTAPEEGSILYQQSGGRGSFKTICYSNFYPDKMKPLMETAINQTLDKIALLTGQKYPKGFSEKKSDLDIEGMAADLGMSVVAWNDGHIAQLNELWKIYKMQGQKGLKRHGSTMKREMGKLVHEKEEANAAELLRRQFNKKTAAASVVITGSGSFDSVNAEGTNITPAYDYIKKNLER